MTPDELKRMMADTDKSSYWENNLTEYGIESLDTDALEEFYKKAVSCGRLEEMAKYDAVELLTGVSRKYIAAAPKIISSGSFAYVRNPDEWEPAMTYDTFPDRLLIFGP